MCGNFATLSRMLTIMSAALDEGRLRGAVVQRAFLWHAYRVLELAAVSEGHDLAYGWPLLGIPDPGGNRRLGVAPVGQASLASFHREQQVLGQQMGYGRGKGGGLTGP